MPSFFADLKEKLSHFSGYFLAFGVLGVLIVLLFPVPTLILDTLLALSVAISMIVLMTTLFIHKALELSVFPTILLVTTMLRLSLNIASTRLILSNGHNGSSAAGEVIEAFGHFVMQGNVVIGLIVFLILTLINFIVITKGSGRIAEVAARFSLDAMPGKQMAIDADLGSGLITEDVAKVRRKELETESAFYGAMDGANKFVRGDAIAALIITFINLVGGMIIGILQRGLSFSDAMHVYSTLTIGEGLISQIPALIISLASGLLVTKSGSDRNTDQALFDQLSKYYQALWMTALVTTALGIAPGMPFVPFFCLGGLSGVAGYFVYKSQHKEEKKITKPDDSFSSLFGSKTPSSPFDKPSLPPLPSLDDNNFGKTEKPTSPFDFDKDFFAPIKKPSFDNYSQDTVNQQKVSDMLRLDILSLEVGYGLLYILKNEQRAQLMNSLQDVRKTIIKEYGFVMPSVKIRDDLSLARNIYCIKIKEIVVASGQIEPLHLLIMQKDPEDDLSQLTGIDCLDPIFNLPAKWVPDNMKDQLVYHSWITPTELVATHITEVVKEYLPELLSYSETQKLVQDIPTDYQKLVKDLIPDIVSVGLLQKVLQALLAEHVSVRDLPTILESIGEIIKVTRSIINITEFVRSRIGLQISYKYLDQDNTLPIINLSPNLENQFINGLAGEEEKMWVIAPSILNDFITRLSQKYDEIISVQNILPVLLCNPRLRPYLRQIIARTNPKIPVLSTAEIPTRLQLKMMGIIE
ncbi:Flagellar biosynthesis protein FlhA [Rickettsiales endosymbiont of Paramecium tredecaurelia]|uniref:flagellar biosynthesis protein FlhA n=1 Tax=Candidatus Sarmatiella mevalonica TaxID=2770581 RepID=UPI001922CB8B|nr:flagellar biosynthesis protein FlhA [Candidatus Sarmatiella mevalonica]MBL3284855.1 Flagellar biosynthesis protein FlhA [Candidatus Sarmatiella mevalonica]